MVLGAFVDQGGSRIETATTPGAVVGPRNCGYSRSITVTSGHSEPQLNSHIGRDEARVSGLCGGVQVVEQDVWE